MWKELLAGLRKRFFGEMEEEETQSGEGVLALTEVGFTLDTGQGAREFRWADVRRIVAFKVDLLTTDVICLTLQLPDGTGAVVNERMEGFADWMTAMGEHIPLADESWYLTIMTPVFEPTPILLYDADAAPSPAPPPASS